MVQVKLTVEENSSVFSLNRMC